MVMRGWESYVPPGKNDGKVQRPTRSKVCEDDAIGFQCRALKLPEPVREFRFHPVRRWKFDYLWVDLKLAMEVQGGLFLPGGGRHNRGAAMLDEFEKLNHAAVMGYRVIFTTPQKLASGEIVAWLEPFLRQRTGQ